MKSCYFVASNSFSYESLPTFNCVIFERVAIIDTTCGKNHKRKEKPTTVEHSRTRLLKCFSWFAWLHKKWKVNVKG